MALAWPPPKQMLWSQSALGVPGKPQPVFPKSLTLQVPKAFVPPKPTPPPIFPAAGEGGSREQVPLRVSSRFPFLQQWAPGQAQAGAPGAVLRGPGDWWVSLGVGILEAQHGFQEGCAEKSFGFG